MEIVFTYPLGFGKACLVFIGIQAFKQNAPKMQGGLTGSHKDRFEHIFFPAKKNTEKVGLLPQTPDFSGQFTNSKGQRYLLLC